MTNETTKVQKSINRVCKFIEQSFHEGIAPVSFERVCVACGFSPSKLYSYIPLITDTYPWIKYDNRRFSFDLFIFVEHNPDTHSTQNKQTNKQEASSSSIVEDK